MTKGHRKGNKHKTFKNRTHVYPAKGPFFIIDNDDWERVKKHTWCWSDRKQEKRYVRNGEKVRLHRFLHGVPACGFVVDHINRNKRDNRKKNLRFATHSQSCMNRSAKSGKPLPPGIQFRRPRAGRRGAFRVAIGYMKKLHRFGQYQTLDEAIKVLHEQKAKLHGEFSSVKGRENGD